MVDLVLFAAALEKPWWTGSVSHLLVLTVNRCGRAPQAFVVREDT